MLVQEKMPRIKINCKKTPPENVINFLKNYYDSVIFEQEEEAMPITEWNFFTDHKVPPGRAVLIYRENRGWTQKELADRVGLKSRQAVSAIETEKREVSKKVALKLSMIFDVPIERFLL